VRVALGWAPKVHIERLSDLARWATTRQCKPDLDGRRSSPWQRRHRWSATGSRWRAPFGTSWKY